MKTYTTTAKVTEAMTARAMGSGDMNVLATPAMVALMENAAMLAAASDMEDGNTTVGISINTTHVKASKVGATITVTANLVNIDGRKLTFEIEANDEGGLIGKATHERFVVNREKFLSKLG